MILFSSGYFCLIFAVWNLTSPDILANNTELFIHQKFKVFILVYGWAIFDQYKEDDMTGSHGNIT